MSIKDDTGVALTVHHFAPNPTPQTNNHLKRDAEYQYHLPAGVHPLPGLFPSSFGNGLVQREAPKEEEYRSIKACSSLTCKEGQLCICELPRDVSDKSEEGSDKLPVEEM